MEVNDADFKEKVIEKSKEKVVVVDFWATWCAPCTMLSPVLEKVVNSYSHVEFAKLNVDESPKTAAEFEISAIPAIKIFKDGKVVEEFIGVVPEEIVRRHIDKALK